MPAVGFFPIHADDVGQLRGEAESSGCRTEFECDGEAKGWDEQRGGGQVCRVFRKGFIIRVADGI